MKSNENYNGCQYLNNKYIQYLGWRRKQLRKLKADNAGVAILAGCNRHQLASQW